MSRRHLFLVALSVFCTSCAGTFKSDVAFNTSEPLRIAVLPFAQIDNSGHLVRADENMLIDDVSIVSSRLKQTPAEFLQNLVQNELSKASLDIIAPAVVEAELSHNGFDGTHNGNLEVDVEKVFRTPASTICSELLSCDAVLYGKISKWDRNYYGIQAVATVAYDLKLVSARTGKVLFSASAEDSDSRGITKGPTGFSNLVLEPLKGLDNEIITTLASEMVPQSLAPLYAKNRPEFLKTAPPAILASAHDAYRGEIPRGGKLTVLALGTPKGLASFSVGSHAEGIPMIERGAGHYIGEYIPLEGERFENQRVAVSLRDGFGRTTVQKLGRVAVSYR